MNISPGVPRKHLVDTLRPFLKIYLLERYSFSSMTRKYSAKKVEYELNRFIEKNPLFGRRVAVATSTPAVNYRNIFGSINPQNQVVKQETKYITETTEYPRYCVSNYMNTHIYDDDVFYRYIDTGDTEETYNDTLDEYEQQEQEQQEQEEQEQQEQEQQEQEHTETIGTQTGIAFAFSHPSQNIHLTQTQEIPTTYYPTNPIIANLERTRTPEQIRETTLAILSRLGRIRTTMEREQQGLLTNNAEIESEDEEVIDNTENDEYESEEEDDDADSVS